MSILPCIEQTGIVDNVDYCNGDYAGHFQGKVGGIRIDAFICPDADSMDTKSAWSEDNYNGQRAYTLHYPGILKPPMKNLD